MKSAIVTGASGFIGAHLAAELLGSGVRVTALCLRNDPNRARIPPQANVVHEMKALSKADVFFHLAWEGASGPDRADAIVQTRSAELTLEALLTAGRLGCKRFIALGTVYERLAPQIIASEKFGGPDFYILSKAHAHSMADQLAYQLGIEFHWCTICHPIGRYIKPDQLMASVVSSLRSGISPPLGPARTIFDMVAVEDVARGLRLLGGAHAPKRREYYIGSGFARPLYQWLEDARDILGVNTPLGFGERGDDGLEFEESWFQISPLREDTGYTPEISFAQAVENILRR